jgi:hypothetical protein
MQYLLHTGMVDRRQSPVQVLGFRPQDSLRMIPSSGFPFQDSLRRIPTSFPVQAYYDYLNFVVQYLSLAPKVKHPSPDQISLGPLITRLKRWVTRV